MNVLIKEMGGILSKYNLYQVTTMHTFNILQFCQLYLYKAGKKQIHTIKDFKSVLNRFFSMKAI